MHHTTGPVTHDGLCVRSTRWAALRRHRHTLCARCKSAYIYVSWPWSAPKPGQFLRATLRHAGCFSFLCLPVSPVLPSPPTKQTFGYLDRSSLEGGDITSVDKECHNVGPLYTGTADLAPSCLPHGGYQPFYKYCSLRVC